jgi:hypothetical protein
MHRSRQVGTLVFALVLAPLLAAAEPPRGDGCYVPPAESVGRLMDSLSSLFSAVSRSLPAPPPASDVEVARTRVNALRPLTGRNAHLLGMEIGPALAHWSAPEIVSRRNGFGNRMRVDLALDDDGLASFLETGLLPSSPALSGLDLGDKVSRGSLHWSERGVPTGDGAVVRLRADRTSDRTLVVSRPLDSLGSRRAFESNVFDWRGAPQLVLHRAVTPPSPRPEALVLGPVTSGDVESISLPGAEEWNARALEISRRHPAITITRRPL